MAITAGVLQNLAILPGGSFLRNAAPQGSPSPSYIENKIVVTAGTAVYMNLPANVRRVVFGASGNFCVRCNKVQAATDAAAFTNTTDGRGCEVNPSGFYFTDVVRELSFDSTANATNISVACYF